MSARGRIAVLLAAAFALTSNLVAHARASRPTQDSSAKNAPQASSTAAAALPPEIRGVLEDAHALLGEASAAAEALDAPTARALGEEAADLLFPLLEDESVTASEPLRRELHSLAYLADRLGEIAALEDARMLGRRLVRGFEQSRATEHVEFYYSRAILAFVENDIRTAARFLELEVEARQRMLAPDDPDLLRARGNLAATLWTLGDLPRARELQESVLASRERTLPADHPDLLLDRERLAVTLQNLDDLPRARELQESVVAGRERTLPAEHPEILRARGILATMLSPGDIKRARELQESVLAGYERSLPREHPDVLLARRRLAVTLWRLGDLARARELQESVLATYERTLPAEHPDLLDVRACYAATLWSLGDLTRARQIQESVLTAYERSRPPDHPEILSARANLAATLHALGDLARARELQESVLVAEERSLPADHPDLLRNRTNLALMLHDLGDLARARELQERVLAALERILPADHPELQIARSNLAMTLHGLGDFVHARELEESVVATCERTLPADHRDLLCFRTNLAVTLKQLGDFARARELQESVVAARERTLSPDHLDLMHARANLATTLKYLGEPTLARELEEEVLAVRERTLPADHPDLLLARGNLASTLVLLDDFAGAREQLPGLVAILLRRALGLVALSPREAGAVAAIDVIPVAEALFLGDCPDSSASQSTFELVETRRHMSQALPSAALLSDPEIEGWRAEAGSLRARLSDLVSGSASEGSQEDLAGEVGRLSLERDRVERRIRSKLAKEGAFTDSIRAEALAQALPPGSAAAGFLRYPRMVPHRETRTWSKEDALLAHVVRADGRVERIELGTASEIEQLVRSWREALGKPIERGIAAATEGEDAERAAGEALRARVLDPLLAAAAGDGELETLHVCLDDMLFLVPLDALPLGEGRVGDRQRIVTEVSFARLLAPPQALTSAPTLVALGGASFDAELEGGAAPIPDAATPPLVLAERSGRPDSFAPLLQTRLEVETLAQIFDEAFDVEAVLLTQKDATKRSLHDHAPGARFLHLATHGWFALESVASVVDPRPDEGWERMDAQETITGFAPMTLCGLALAGANKGRDSLGRVPGILTAEELASLDLSRCELAVLSACETNVGVRRAGQGIQSLQAALHAAGTRTAITSLWKVDDAATRRLMELFYTKLWVEKEPKARALWEAKMALRAEGAPVRDWAAWVLSGNPE